MFFTINSEQISDMLTMFWRILCFCQNISIFESMLVFIVLLLILSSFFLETNAFFLGFYFLFYMHVFVMVVIDNVLILIVFYLVYTCTWVFFSWKKDVTMKSFYRIFFIVHQLQQSSPTHFIRINYCRSYNLMCCPFYLCKIWRIKYPSINKRGINNKIYIYASFVSSKQLIFTQLFVREESV